MLQIQFALHLVQIPDFAIGKCLPLHYRAPFMLYGWCDTGGYNFVTKFSQRLNPPILAKYFELWFVSPKNFIPLSSICTPWPTGAFWHYFASSPVVSWLQFCHIGQFHRVFSHRRCWQIFSRHWSSCAVIFGAISLLWRKLWLMKLSDALVVAFGLQALDLVLFCPVSWCLLTV